MRLVHSADWQIGARFRQFGGKSSALSESRLRTLRRALEYAVSREVDAFLIAGDLFEDNQVAPSVIAEVFEILCEFDRVPIFVLPGNHDPFTGPASVWGRKPFLSAPPHLKVFTLPQAVPAGSGWIVANPLTQKRSTTDPSRKLADLAQSIPEEAILVGITHGSPAIESRHQADDFPIALDAATQAGLDFLALGHWHSQLLLDGGRMLMPGTPEPTDFTETGSGFIHEVEISARGSLPKITPFKISEWNWRQHVCDVTDLIRARMDYSAMLTETAVSPANRAISRIILRGSALPQALEEFKTWIKCQSRAGNIIDFRDDTSPELTAAELAVLREEHPLLGKVIDDLKCLAFQDGGQTAVPLEGRAFSPAEFLAICERIGCAPAEATAEFIGTAQRLLWSELRKVAAEC